MLHDYNLFKHQNISKRDQNINKGKMWKQIWFEIPTNITPNWMSLVGRCPKSKIEHDHFCILVIVHPKFPFLFSIYIDFVVSLLNTAAIKWNLIYLSHFAYICLSCSSYDWPFVALRKIIDKQKTWIVLSNYMNSSRYRKKNNNKTHVVTTQTINSNRDNNIKYRIKIL